MNRKVFVIILALVMTLSFAACGTEKAEDQSDEVVEETAVPSTVSAETNDGNLDEEMSADSVESEPEAFADGEVAAYHTPTPATSAAPVATPVPTKAPAAEEKPEEDADSETEGDYEPSVGLTEYERYNAMSGEEQQAYMESFGSVEAFVSWYNSAREEYESGRIEIDGSEINAGDLVG